MKGYSVVYLDLSDFNGGGDAAPFFQEGCEWYTQLVVLPQQAHPISEASLNEPIDELMKGALGGPEKGSPEDPGALKCEPDDLIANLPVGEAQGHVNTPGIRVAARMEAQGQPDLVLPDVQLFHCQGGHPEAVQVENNPPAVNARQSADNAFYV